MLINLLFFTALFLSLRSFGLAAFEKKAKPLRLLDLCFALLYLASFVLVLINGRELFSIGWKTLALLLGIYGFAFGANFYLRLKYGFRHLTLKAVGFALFLLFFSWNLTLAGFLQATSENELIRVVITGEREHNKAQVKLESLRGELLAEFYIPGDFVTLRAKVIRVKPFLSFLGISNLCKIERISNSFRNAKQEKNFPRFAEELTLSHAKSFPCFFENFWEELFFQKAKSFWIKSALMQASYFPLIERSGKPFKGEYLLTLTSTGLSSLAIADEKKIR